MSSLRYTAASIARIVDGEIQDSGNRDQEIRELLIDSRRLTHPDRSMFIALVSDRNDGHRYIPELVERGVRCFLVSSGQWAVGSWQLAVGSNRHPAASVQDPGSSIHDPLFIVVPDTLAALQKLAAHHRQQFTYPVIGITGSNGKTIVKEWLYQLLSPGMDIVRSPKSYNSQIGVPLSVWNMDARNDLAIIEAGISEPGEMERLEQVIKPTVGIFTTIGPAHDVHFKNKAEKVDEKLKLFRDADILIYRSDYPIITERLDASADYRNLNRFTWGSRENDNLKITAIHKEGEHTVIKGICEGEIREITIPFTDDASIENAIHCWALIQLGIPHSSLNRFAGLSPIAMRLELKDAINNCSLINDSYNADINSLGIALDFLARQKQHSKRTVILSDILQTGRSGEELYAEVAGIIGSRKINRIIGIGKEISQFQHRFTMHTEFFPTTEEFLAHFPLSSFRDETILLKGSRVFGFERISQALQQKAHETVLEINLDALVHNLNYFRAKLKPEVQTMAMVKAFSYGSGSFEIANLLQFHQVDCLAVAYADEGVELRKAGITMPIMVMSPEEQSLDTLLAWNLEPEIYSFRILQMLAEAMTRSDLPLHQDVRIHVKLDTGMHRLGFCEPDLEKLSALLKQNPRLNVRSVFSHLAASEDPAQDAFTGEQFTRFLKMSDAVTSRLDYPVKMHILNSAGISRFPEMQLNMVRLGIGLYGIGYNPEEQQKLRNVSRLRTVITQIKKVKQGETVGYNRRGVAEKNTVIAVVPVGYADGLDRRLGNGTGVMFVNGKPAPIMGNVCMDLCMLDITSIVEGGMKVEEGNEVVVFGEDYPVTSLSAILHTIPYEIMTGISRRVKRIYYHE
ncbi:MAG: bifunctional UDP-N-acetylmuramoyl-tripeptide:D-alanyl-D-alanine ligase/alanine racemase [Bacteroidales bacterium]|nr:bifunctional UDP-N-acetylmuramoyl-tripeptide:D-alanyl-D-alanine ligase/alanine racemase [Bacteroidales bacterium]